MMIYSYLMVILNGWNQVLVEIAEAIVSQVTLGAGPVAMALLPAWIRHTP